MLGYVMRGTALGFCAAAERDTMTERVQWNKAEWPIAVVRFTEVLVGRQAMVEYYDHVIELLARKERFVVLVVPETAGSSLDREARVYAASVNQSHKEELGKYLSAFAIVSDSVIARTSLTAVNWIVPFPFPTKAFRSLDEAKAWAKTRLEST